jgi:antitoxin VapB
MYCRDIRFGISFPVTQEVSMPLYIRDDSVDDLAVKLMKLTGASNKTEAVRDALLARMASVEQKRPLLDRITDAQVIADRIGPVDRDQDLKAFMDEMWGDA